MTGLQPVKKFTPFSVEALLADVVSSGPRDVQEAQVTSSSSSNSEPDLCLPPEQALHWGAAWFARSPTTPGLGECPLPLHRRPTWTRPRELAAFQPRSAARALVQWRQGRNRYELTFAADRSLKRADGARFFAGVSGT